MNFSVKDLDDEQMHGRLTSPVLFSLKEMVQLLLSQVQTFSPQRMEMSVSLILVRVVMMVRVE